MAKKINILLDRLVVQAREIERLNEELKTAKGHRDDYCRWWQEEQASKDVALSELKDAQGLICELQAGIEACGMDTEEYPELKKLL